MSRFSLTLLGSTVALALLGACSNLSSDLSSLVGSSPAPVTVTATTPSAVVLAVDAYNCYQAVKAGTPASSTLQNVVTGAQVIASNPACVALDSAAATKIAAALNSGTPAVPAAATTPATK
jgi:hypothetical protein